MRSLNSQSSSIFSDNPSRKLSRSSLSSRIRGDGISALLLPFMIVNGENPSNRIHSSHQHRKQQFRGWNCDCPISILDPFEKIYNVRKADTLVHVGDFPRLLQHHFCSSVEVPTPRECQLWHALAELPGGHLWSAERRVSSGLGTGRWTQPSDSKNVVEKRKGCRSKPRDPGRKLLLLVLDEDFSSVNELHGV